MLEDVQSGIERELRARGLRAGEPGSADLLVEYHLWVWHDVEAVTDVQLSPVLPAAADRAAPPSAIPMTTAPPTASGGVVERLQVEVRIAIVERASGEVAYSAGARYEYRTGSVRHPTIQQIVARLFKDW
jgi:hypothetical protein